MVHAYKGGREGEGREGEGSTPHNLELHSTYIYCTGKLSLLPCPQVSLHADVAIQAIYVAKLTIDEYDWLIRLQLLWVHFSKCLATKCKHYSADTGEEGKKGKINVRPGIEQMEVFLSFFTCVSRVILICVARYLLKRWRMKEGKDKLPYGHRMDGSYLSFLSFFTCVSRVILTIPSPGDLRLPNSYKMCLWDVEVKSLLLVL